MKAVMWLVACLLLLSPAGALAQDEGPHVDLTQAEPFPLTRATLPNGLRVWVQARPDGESVAALLVVRAGARDETPYNSGISHFVEHMVFTGTERWSEAEIKEVIEKRGGNWNGSTGSETTIYYAHVAAQDLDVALEWLSQVVFHPTFPADKVDKERGVIFEEKSGRYGWLVHLLEELGLGYDLDRRIDLALFPGSGLGLRVIGEDESLDRLDRDSLLAYYKERYAAGNAVLILVGEVVPATVLARASEIFAEPGSAAVPPEVPPMPGGGPYRVIVRGPQITDQVTLVIGARTVGSAHPDRWPLAVLAEMLGKDLMEDVRYEQGLVYAISAYNVRYSDAGYFAVSTSAKRGRIETIRFAIEKRLEAVRSGDVDDTAVADAKAALSGRWALSMEDNLVRASWLAGWAFVLGPDEPLPDYRAAIGAVTPEDLTRVAQTYFTPERSFVGLHDPILTVAGAAWPAGGFLALLLVAWGGVRLRRRRAKRAARREEQTR